MDANTDSTAVCAFCCQSTDISPGGDGVEILISRRGEDGTKEVFAHMSCLGARLHPGTPYLFKNGRNPHWSWLRASQASLAVLALLLLLCTQHAQRRVGVLDGHAAREHVAPRVAHQ